MGLGERHNRGPQHRHAWAGVPLPVQPAEVSAANVLAPVLQRILEIIEIEHIGAAAVADPEGCLVDEAVEVGTACEGISINA